MSKTQNYFLILLYIVLNLSQTKQERKNCIIYPEQAIFDSSEAQTVNAAVNQQSSPVSNTGFYVPNEQSYIQLLKQTNNTLFSENLALQNQYFSFPGLSIGGWYKWNSARRGVSLFEMESYDSGSENSYMYIIASNKDSYDTQNDIQIKLCTDQVTHNVCRIKEYQNVLIFEQWILWTVVIDRLQEIILYRDGIEQENGQWIKQDHSVPIYPGKYDTTGLKSQSTTPGSSMDDFRIYPRTLSESEMKCWADICDFKCKTCSKEIDICIECTNEDMEPPLCVKKINSPQSPNNPDNNSQNQNNKESKTGLQIYLNIICILGLALILPLYYYNKTHIIWYFIEQGIFMYSFLFININYSNDLKKFLQGLNYLQFDFMPNLFEAFVDHEKHYITQNDNQFTNLKSSKLFIINIGNQATALLIIAIILLVLKAFHEILIYLKTWQKQRKIIQNYIFAPIKWNGISYLVLILYQQFSIFSILQLINFGETSAIYITNYAIWGISLIFIVLAFPGYATVVLQSYVEEISEFIEEKWHMFFAQISDPSINKKLLYYLIFFLKKFLISFVLVLLQSLPIVQSIIFTIISILSLLYLLTFKPLENKKRVILQASIDVFNTILSLLYIIISTQDDEVSSFFSTLIKLLITIMQTLLFLDLLFQTGLSFFSKAKSSLKKQNQEYTTNMNSSAKRPSKIPRISLKKIPNEYNADFESQYITSASPNNSRSNIEQYSQRKSMKIANFQQELNNIRARQSINMAQSVPMQEYQNRKSQMLLQLPKSQSQASLLVSKSPNKVTPAKRSSRMTPLFSNGSKSTSPSKRLSNSNSNVFSFNASDSRPSNVRKSDLRAFNIIKEQEEADKDSLYNKQQQQNFAKKEKDDIYLSQLSSNKPDFQGVNNKQRHARQSKAFNMISPQYQ